MENGELWYRALHDDSITRFTRILSRSWKFHIHFPFSILHFPLTPRLLEQLCRLQAVILMGSHNGGVRHDPAQVKGRIAQNNIKMRLGLIVTHVTL